MVNCLEHFMFVSVDSAISLVLNAEELGLGLGERQWMLKNCQV